MYCRKCGKQINDDAKFCKYCGTPVKRNNKPGVQQNRGAQQNREVQQNRETQQRQVMHQTPVMQQVPPDNSAAFQRNIQPEPEKKAKKSPLITVLVVVIVALVAIAAGGVGTMWYMGAGPFAKSDDTTINSENDQSDEKDSSEDKSAKEDTTDQETDTKTDDKDTDDKKLDQKTIDTENSRSKAPSFKINRSTDADYSNVTDLSDYVIYHSADSDHFSFYYPKNLYNSVDYSDNPDDSFDLTENYAAKNAELISFSGNDGSRLIYQMAQVTGDGSLDDIVNSIEDEIKNGTGMDSSTTLLKKKKGGNAYVVVTGTTSDGFIKYIACTAYPNSSGTKLMVMEMQFPDYNGDTDKKNKWYYNEVLYRGLGFGYSDSAVRSYDDFSEDYKG